MKFPSLFRRCTAVASMSGACLLAPSAQASVVLQVNAQGILTGATGITVGTLPGTYSVKFVDGTCASVYGACDVAHLTFTNLNDATAASRALLTDVFIDSSLGQFDSDPSLTFGCTSVVVCNVFTVRDVVSVLTFPEGAIDKSFARNQDSGPRQGVFNSRGSIARDTSSPTNGSSGSEVFAVWVREMSTATSSVPEPGTLALLGLAGAALAWTQGRRRPGAHVQ